MINSVIESLEQFQASQMCIWEDNQEFREMADALPVSLVITKLIDSAILYANSPFQEMLAVSLEQIIGTSFELHHHVSTQNVTELTTLEHDDHQRSQREFCLRKSDGSLIWVSSFGTPLSFAGVPALLSCMTDISEDRQFRLAYHEVSERLNFIVKASKIGTWNWDINDDIMRWDTHMYSIYGLKADGSVCNHSDSMKLVHVDDKIRISQEMLKSFAGNVEFDSKFRIISPSGDLRVLTVRGETYLNEHAEAVRMAGVCWDVTETHMLTRKLSYQASHDALTDLVNRREFERRLERVLKNAKTNQSEHALCYLDLDQFKIINDTCGHTAGDKLLRQIAKQLKQHTRTRDTLARLGGDEFGLIMENCSLQEAVKVSNTLREALREIRFDWHGQFFGVKVSIGLVPITHESESITNLMMAADSACYVAKETGRDRVHEYRAKDTILDYRHDAIRWAVKIEAALEGGRFELYCQPIISQRGNSQDLPSYEFLLRMRDEDDSLILPSDFIHAAEQFDLALRIDKWVIQKSIELIGLHRNVLDKVDMFSINLFGCSLKDIAFREYAMQCLSQDLNIARKICFEITETSAIQNIDKAVEFINTLKNLHCRFALDDFGKGISSFGYLKALPVDILKIDGLFVKDIATDPINYAMVKSINEIAKVMGKTTIAEYVEDAEILSKLNEIGVDYVQGYHLGRPRTFVEYL